MARYYFSCPKIYFGEEAITSLCQFNNKRVGIVTDDFMMSSGKTRYLISHMPEASVCIFGEVTPDPDIDILTSGAARFKAFKPDVIIALGGGSSLDAAKGIKVTLEEYFGDHQIDLIAIPTTSGSGSEVTSYAIISDPQNGRKYPLISGQLVPEIAILDPNLVLTAPRHVAVDTGMDVPPVWQAWHLTPPGWGWYTAWHTPSAGCCIFLMAKLTPCCCRLSSTSTANGPALKPAIAITVARKS